MPSLSKTLLLINNFLAEWRVARFVISGGIAFSVNLLLLYVFTDFFGFWYIYSATLSFIVSLIVGFSMNKTWTFRDNIINKIHKQLLVYFFINVFNLILNNSILYFLVEEFGMWYISAQAFASILVAFESFIVYNWIFRNIGSSNLQ